MAAMDSAIVSRSLRTIKTELEFLTDTNKISRETLQAICALLPSSEIGSITSTLANTTISPTLPAGNSNPYPYNPSPSGQTPYQQPPQPAASTYGQNEKTFQSQAPYQSLPPAYSSAPTLSVVKALYAYQASDAGDLAIHPGDTINVTEYVNNDWWRGVNTKNQATGIFPRSYVQEATPASKEGYGYGNMPLQIANGQQQQQMPDGQQQLQQGGSGKMGAFGKSVGKKLGNAAIFGAGATLGGDLVNAIL